MVAMLLQAENKPDEAKARYEKILQLDPPRWSWRPTISPTWTPRPERIWTIALHRARTAVSVAPDEPDVNDTLGWVYYKRSMAVAGGRRR